MDNINKLIILSKNAEEYRKLIEEEQLPNLEILAAATQPDQIEPGIPGNIVFGESLPVSKILFKLPELQWVQSTHAGIEPFLNPGLRRDYKLTNARVVFGPLMSEYVFAYLLLHERRIIQRFDFQQNQIWDSTGNGTLRGKTIGLLGVGSIGKHLACTAKHFGMNVRGFSRTSQYCEDVDQYYQGEGLQDFTRGLDYLVNSLPNTSETRCMVNSELLSWLPSHAIFINVGRGSTVDEDALIEALLMKKIAGAVLDVFEQEPLPKNHRIWSVPNLFITSHTAAPSIPKDISLIFIENYQRFTQNLPLQYHVDFELGY